MSSAYTVTCSALLLLLIKSLYVLSIFYFEFHLLLTQPALLSIFLAAFYHSVALFLHSKWKHVDLRAVGKDLIVSFSVSWILVGVAGANPFNLNSLAFSLLLSSSAFNLLTIQPFKDPLLLKDVASLKIYNLIKDPVKMTLLFASLGSLIGSILTGLVVILDWDVVWKRFPIPNVIGCIFGESCGIIVSLLLNSFLVIFK